MNHRFQNILTCIISIAVAALILGVMIVRVWDELLIAVADVQYRYLIGSIGLCLSSWLMRGYRYQKILNNLMIPVGLFFSTACIFLSQTINIVVPARLGDLVRVIPIHHEHKGTISQGLSSIIVERLFDIVTIALLGLFEVAFVIDAPAWLASVIVISLFVAGMGVMFILVSKEWRTKNRYLGFVLNMFDEIRMAALTRQAMILLLIISTIIWIFDIMICYFIALMFHVTIPFNLVFLAIIIGNLVKAIPITPGGIGTYELALAATFELGKVPAATATIVSVVDHFIKNLITLIGGMASILYFGTWIIPRITDIVNEKLFKNVEK
jgi:uncharacterized protein (TIRG00374 family)